MRQHPWNTGKNNRVRPKGTEKENTENQAAAFCGCLMRYETMKRIAYMVIKNIFRVPVWFSEYADWAGRKTLIQKKNDMTFCVMW